MPSLITLAVKGISSWIKRKQQKCIDDAVLAMHRQEAEINELRQFSDDFLMYGKYNVETLMDVINTMNSMHKKQTELEKLVASPNFGMTEGVIDAMSFSFDLQLFLWVMEEENVHQLQVLEWASKDVLRGISILSQGRLPQEFFSDKQLLDILKQVEKMIKQDQQHYALAVEHISHYRDMKLVTFAVDQMTHSLIVAFPVFVQDYRRPLLSLYEIESVPVPIPDENKRANSYSMVQIRKPYIVAGVEYYIELRMTEMIMCKTIRFIFYCEELFVVKHKSAHSCASAIYYDLGPKVVTKNCVFNYEFDAVVPPTILDGGKNLLLANFHGPRSLKCDSNDRGLAKPAPKHTYAVVPRDFLCDCQLDLEYASVLRQISSCDEKNSRMVMYFTVNLAFWQYLHNY